MHVIHDTRDRARSCEATCGGATRVHDRTASPPPHHLTTLQLLLPHSYRYRPLLFHLDTPQPSSYSSNRKKKKHNGNKSHILASDESERDRYVHHPTPTHVPLRHSATHCAPDECTGRNRYVTSPITPLAEGAAQNGSTPQVNRVSSSEQRASCMRQEDEATKNGHGHRRHIDVHARQELDSHRDDRRTCHAMTQQSESASSLSGKEDDESIEQRLLQHRYTPACPARRNNGSRSASRGDSSNLFSSVRDGRRVVDSMADMSCSSNDEHRQLLARGAAVEQEETKRRVLPHDSNEDVSERLYVVPETRSSLLRQAYRHWLLLQQHEQERRRHDEEEQLQRMQRRERTQRAMTREGATVHLDEVGDCANGSTLVRDPVEAVAHRANRAVRLREAFVQKRYAKYMKAAKRQRMTQKEQQQRYEEAAQHARGTLSSRHAPLSAPEAHAPCSEGNVAQSEPNHRPRNDPSSHKLLGGAADKKGPADALEEKNVNSNSSSNNGASAVWVVKETRAVRLFRAHMRQQAEAREAAAQARAAEEEEAARLHPTPRLDDTHQRRCQDRDSDDVKSATEASEGHMFRFGDNPSWNDIYSLDTVYNKYAADLNKMAKHTRRQRPKATTRKGNRSNGNAAASCEKDRHDNHNHRMLTDDEAGVAALIEKLHPCSNEREQSLLYTTHPYADEDDAAAAAAAAGRGVFSTRSSRLRRECVVAAEAAWQQAEDAERRQRVLGKGNDSKTQQHSSRSLHTIHDPTSFQTSRHGMRQSDHPALPYNAHATHWQERHATRSTWIGRECCDHDGADDDEDASHTSIGGMRGHSYRTHTQCSQTEGGDGTHASSPPDSPDCRVLTRDADTQMCRGEVHDALARPFLRNAGHGNARHHGEAVRASTTHSDRAGRVTEAHGSGDEKARGPSPCATPYHSGSEEATHTRSAENTGRPLAASRNSSCVMPRSDSAMSKSTCRSRTTSREPCANQSDHKLQSPAHALSILTGQSVSVAAHTQSGSLPPPCAPGCAETPADPTKPVCQSTATNAHAQCAHDEMVTAHRDATKTARDDDDASEGVSCVASTHDQQGEARATIAQLNASERRSQLRAALLARARARKQPQHCTNEQPPPPPPPQQQQQHEGLKQHDTSASLSIDSKTAHHVKPAQTVATKMDLHDCVLHPASTATTAATHTPVPALYAIVRKPAPAAPAMPMQSISSSTSVPLNAASTTRLTPATATTNESRIVAAAAHDAVMRGECNHRPRNVQPNDKGNAHHVEGSAVRSDTTKPPSDLIQTTTSSGLICTKEGTSPSEVYSSSVQVALDDVHCTSTERLSAIQRLALLLHQKQHQRKSQQQQQQMLRSEPTTSRGSPTDMARPHPVHDLATAPAKEPVMAKEEEQKQMDMDADEKSAHTVHVTERAFAPMTVDAPGSKRVMPAHCSTSPIRLVRFTLPVTMDTRTNFSCFATHAARPRSLSALTRVLALKAEQKKRQGDTNTHAGEATNKVNLDKVTCCAHSHVDSSTGSRSNTNEAATRTHDSQDAKHGKASHAPARRTPDAAAAATSLTASASPAQRQDARHATGCRVAQMKPVPAMHTCDALCEDMVHRVSTGERKRDACNMHDSISNKIDHGKTAAASALDEEEALCQLSQDSFLASEKRPSSPGTAANNEKPPPPQVLGVTQSAVATTTTTATTHNGTAEQRLRCDRVGNARRSHSPPQSIVLPHLQRSNGEADSSCVGVYNNGHACNTHCIIDANCSDASGWAATSKDHHRASSCVLDATATNRSCPHSDHDDTRGIGRCTQTQRAHTEDGQKSAGARAATCAPTARWREVSAVRATSSHRCTALSPLPSSPPPRSCRCANGTHAVQAPRSPVVTKPCATLGPVDPPGHVAPREEERRVCRLNAQRTRRTNAVTPPNGVGSSDTHTKRIDFDDCYTDSSPIKSSSSSSSGYDQHPTSNCTIRLHDTSRIGSASSRSSVNSNTNRTPMNGAPTPCEDESKEPVSCGCAAGGTHSSHACKAESSSLMFGDAAAWCAERLSPSRTPPSPARVPMDPCSILDEEEEPDMDGTCSSHAKQDNTPSAPPPPPPKHAYPVTVMSDFSAHGKAVHSGAHAVADDARETHRHACLAEEEEEPQQPSRSMCVASHSLASEEWLCHDAHAYHTIPDEEVEEQHVYGHDEVQDVQCAIHSPGSAHTPRWSTASHSVSHRLFHTVAEAMIASVSERDYSDEEEKDHVEGWYDATGRADGGEWSPVWAKKRAMASAHPHQHATNTRGDGRNSRDDDASHGWTSHAVADERDDRAGHDLATGVPSDTAWVPEATRWCVRGVKPPPQHAPTPRMHTLMPSRFASPSPHRTGELWQSASEGDALYTTPSPNTHSDGSDGKDEIVASTHSSCSRDTDDAIDSNRETRKHNTKDARAGSDCDANTEHVPSNASEDGLVHPAGSETEQTRDETCDRQRDEDAMVCAAGDAVLLCDRMVTTGYGVPGGLSDSSDATHHRHRAEDDGDSPSYSIDDTSPTPHERRENDNASESAAHARRDGNTVQQDISLLALANKSHSKVTDLPFSYGGSCSSRPSLHARQRGRGEEDIRAYAPEEEEMRMSLLSRPHTAASAVVICAAAAAAASTLSSSFVSPLPAGQGEAAATARTDSWMSAPHDCNDADSASESESTPMVVESVLVTLTPTPVKCPSSSQRRPSKEAVCVPAMCATHSLPDEELLVMRGMQTESSVVSVASHTASVNRTSNPYRHNDPAACNTAPCVSNKGDGMMHDICAQHVRSMHTGTDVCAEQGEGGTAGNEGAVNVVEGVFLHRAMYPNTLTPPAASRVGSSSPYSFSSSSSSYVSSTQQHAWTPSSPHCTPQRTSMGVAWEWE